VSNAQPNQQLTYRWSPTSQIISGANSAHPLIAPSRNTVYHVTVTNQIGCTFTDSIRINILSAALLVTASASPDSIVLGDTTQLHVALSANVTSFRWLTDSTLSSTIIENPLAFPPATHTYFVEATDSQGCRKRDSVTVFIIHTPCAESNLYIPNAFSPNNAGKNDVLFVRGNNITKLYFAVYDRWGQKVFETKDITKGWDGTFKGRKIDPAVFGWYAEGVCESGEQFFKKGNVTLLR
jgi:gliding motility-associated-like protein